MTVNDFFRQYGSRLIEVNTDDVETGDFVLFAPEEEDRARSLKEQGYIIASIYDGEHEDDEDNVVVDNHVGPHPLKKGYLVIEPLATNQPEDE